MTRHDASAHVHEPLPVDDPKVRRPDTTMARRLLHWQPTVSLRDGLGYTIESFRASALTG